MRALAKLLTALVLCLGSLLPVYAAPLGYDVAILNGPPCAFPGSAIDLNFQLNAATLNCHSAGLATAQLTITRATVGYAQYQSGIWQQFPSGTFRITDKGLLVEEARTNSALWARDMTNAAWTKVNMTTALTATGIDGTANSATTLTATAGNATALQSIVAISQADTYSVWLKRVTGTGTVNISLDGVSWTAAAVTTTWTRFSVTSTLLNPNLGIQIVTNGDVIAADFNQAELGSSFATSPILTTTVAATRNADSILLTSNGTLSLSSGTWFLEWLEVVGPVSVQAMLLRMRVDPNNFISLERSSSNKGSNNVQVAGVSQASMSSTSNVVANTPYREALTYQTNDFAASYTPSLQATVITDVSGSVPSGVFTVALGSNNGTAAFFNGYLRRITWFPSRVSNGQMLGWTQGTIQ